MFLLFLILTVFFSIGNFIELGKDPENRQFWGSVGECWTAWSRCTGWSYGLTGWAWQTWPQRCQYLGRAGGSCKLKTSKCPSHQKLTIVIAMEPEQGQSHHGVDFKTNLLTWIWLHWLDLLNKLDIIWWSCSRFFMFKIIKHMCLLLNTRLPGAVPQPLFYFLLF